MPLQLQAQFYRIFLPPFPLDASDASSFRVTRKPGMHRGRNGLYLSRRFWEPRSRQFCACAATAWENWAPEKGSEAPSLSDVFWPSAGAFVAMALLGKIDQILAPKGISISIAPLGAVCAVLFTAPTSPSARKYNMFVAQVGCASLGVSSFMMFGYGWLAKSIALASSLAFMILMRAVHPPAAGLSLLFIDGVKLHPLKFWYAFFPGAAGCIVLILLQEIVSYLKQRFRF